MKFKVQMKDPDTLIDSIEDAVNADLSGSGLPDDEREILGTARKEKVYSLCGKWFRYGEYLTVEIDTEAETCTVLPADRSL